MTTIRFHLHIALVLCGAVLLVGMQPVDAATDTDERWHVGPRVGLSYATGLIGVEAQRGHLGMAVGFMPFCTGDAPGVCDYIETAALKYHVNGTGNTWSAGIFSWSWKEYSGRDNFLGVAIEHHWQFESGWGVAVGVGLGQQGRDVEAYNPMPSVSFGYSF